MIHYKTPEEVEKMRKACLLVGETIAEVAKHIKPGVTTLELDTLAEKFILDHGATPAFKHYNGFPFTCCISVNEAVVHGFPNNQPLKEGDLVSIDSGTVIDGYHGDSAYTFALKGASEDVLKLMKVTKESLYIGIDKARAGNRIGDISHAIQEYTERNHRYGVVRELVGHGIGLELHEDPQVPNYGKRGSGAQLKEGLVIAIEPMINMGKKDVVNDADGWTIKTKDRKPSAHYEHTICVRKDKADILSSFEKIEQAERENEHLCSGY